MKPSSLPLFLAVASYFQGKTAAVDVHFKDMTTCTNTVGPWFQEVSVKRVDPSVDPFSPQGEAWGDLYLLLRGLNPNFSAAQLTENCGTTNHDGHVIATGTITHSYIDCSFLNYPGAVEFWNTNIVASLQPSVDWYNNGGPINPPSGGIPRAYSVICPCPSSDTANNNFEACQLQATLDNDQQCATRS